jgi:hypothetical protein
MNKNKPKGSLVVCDIHKTPMRPIAADIGQALLRGSGCLEEAEASECCTFPGSYDGAITARVEVDAQWDIVGICEGQP